ncbi:MAG TPA: hypothetical protein VFC86_11875 [Planctomycetota bacterium]|nr:hypothetical protein [Planctomycetota bacterium]
MKTVVCTALGLVLAAGLSHPQEPAGSAGTPEKRCDAAKVENRAFCMGCEGFPAAADIEKGACKKCKTKVMDVPTCVKSAFKCRMHGDNEVLHSKRCCKPEVKDCCNEVTTLARVEYRCEACNQRGFVEKEVRHVKEGCAGKIARTCEKSGTFPHGGEEIKAEGAPKPADAPK